MMSAIAEKIEDPCNMLGTLMNYLGNLIPGFLPTVRCKIFRGPHGPISLEVGRRSKPKATIAWHLSLFHDGRRSGKEAQARDLKKAAPRELP